MYSQASRILSGKSRPLLSPAPLRHYLARNERGDRGDSA